MKPINECKTVAELLEQPERWTKGGTGIRNASGLLIDDVRANEACAFCLYTAVSRIYDWSGSAYGVRTRIRQCILKTQGDNVGIIQWNDAPERTHTEVLALAKELGI